MLIDKIATFEKVSYNEFRNAIKKLNINITDREICKSYDNIILPRRATSGSVGYDFYLPFDISMQRGDSIIIPTGIRCKMQEGFSLDIYPKSGLGFKYQLVVANVVGIIDSDYYNSDNEGHIMVKLIYKGFDITDGNMIRKESDSFVQGIFHECFGATNDNDNTTMKIRNGGFDSTNK